MLKWDNRRVNECPRFGEAELRDEVTDEWDWVVCWSQRFREREWGGLIGLLCPFGLID